MRRRRVDLEFCPPKKCLFLWCVNSDLYYYYYYYYSYLYVVDDYKDFLFLVIVDMTVLPITVLVLLH